MFYLNSSLSTLYTFCFMYLPLGLSFMIIMCHLQYGERDE